MRTIQYVSCFLLCVSLSSNVRAVTGPSQVCRSEEIGQVKEAQVDLSTVDRFLAPVDWLSSFGRDQITKFEFEEISFMGSSKQNSQVKSHLKSDSVVEIVSADMSGQPNSVAEITKEVWFKNNGNLVRYFVSQTQSFGIKFQLKEIN